MSEPSRMKQYRIVYGGHMTIEADTPEEAYLWFWSEIKARCDEGRLGVIVEVEEDHEQPF
jgi:hypothetical protein